MNQRYPPDSEAVLDDADHDQLASRQRIGQQAQCSGSADRLGEGGPSRVIDEIVREGARRMLATEVNGYLVELAGRVTSHDRARGTPAAVP
jgi:hypothetical protein